MVPLPALPLAVPSTNQFTAVLEVPVTFAVNCRVAPVVTLADVGLMEIAMAGATTVTLACALLDASAPLVTPTLCVPGVPGAVYMPALLIRPTPAFPPLMPSTSHAALLSAVPLMVTENCCDAPVFTVAELGVTATLTVADEPPLLFNELPPPPPPPQLTSTTKHGSRRR